MTKTTFINRWVGHFQLPRLQSAALDLPNSEERDAVFRRIAEIQSELRGIVENIADKTMCEGVSDESV